MMDRTVFLESLKVFLGIDDTAQDAELLVIIDNAIQTCEEYLGRDLDSGTFTEVLMWFNNSLIVTNWPITDLTSIKDSSGNDMALNNVDWTVRRNVIRSTALPAVWQGQTAVSVTYEAGYDGTEIPQWIITSVDYIAAALYNLQGTGQSITSEATGATKKVQIPGVYTVEYDTSSSESGGVDAGSGSFGVIPETARQQLDFYRDRRVH